MPKGRQDVMETIDKIFACIKANPSTLSYYDDAYLYIKGQFNRDVLKAMINSKRLKELCTGGIRNKMLLIDVRKALVKIKHKVLIMETPYSLDSYFLALEYKRPLSEQFYYPRRKQLLPIIRKLEDLVIWDRLDELFLSMPPRTGKTTMILFLMTWYMGMYPEKANLYGTFSGQTANAFYKGITEIIDDKYTYCWRDVFPNVKYDNKSFCNSKETYLDVGRVKRYHSLTSRSIDGSLNGSCDCSGILVGDDLISGYEEAVNPTRVATVWNKVENDFITRAKEHAKVLWIGTRWSVLDPIGRRIKILTEEPQFATRRVEIINRPALDENGESNFNYDEQVGFSTEYYLQRKASFELYGDVASWSAQYMGEPIERSGQLFNAEELQYFHGQLPTQVVDKIIAPVDVAWGGGDACSCPCMFVYKDKVVKNKIDVYVPAVVFEYGDKNISQPKIVRMIQKWGIQHLQIERNNRGEEYAEDLEKMLKEINYPINITTKSAPNTVSKEGRILQCAPDIKLNWHFLEAPLRDKDYKMFMQNLIGYSVNGKNKHDDAPDSCSQGCDMLRTPLYQGGYEIFRRPF